MNNILDIKSGAISDGSVTRLQYQSYNPYTASFNNNDEIRISIQQQDLYVLPHDSYIYIEGDISRKNNVDPTLALPRFVNCFAGFMFDEIRYELNGVEIDRCKNVGFSNLIKGFPSIPVTDIPFLKISSWNEIDVQATQSTFNLCLPINLLLGFAEDYKKVIMNAKHELILVRSRSDSNCFYGVNDNAQINVKKIQWRIQHVQVSDQSKLMLLKHIERRQPIHMSFRSWDLYEYPALPVTDKHTWAVKTSNQLNKPRYVILGFQTNRNRIQADNSKFDHCDISDVKLYLNSECYPYENMNLNFDNNQYIPAFHAYGKFQESYYHSNNRVKATMFSYADFKAIAPLFIFDCSRQSETIKTSMIDIRLEIQARTNFPANTTGYCMIIHDNLISYNPYSNVVTRAV